MHRRWVALVDDENPEDVGIQGYLHLSIAIVGPGDRLKVHIDHPVPQHIQRPTACSLDWPCRLCLAFVFVVSLDRCCVPCTWKGVVCRVCPLPNTDRLAVLGVLCGVSIVLDRGFLMRGSLCLSPINRSITGLNFFRPSGSTAVDQSHQLPSKNSDELLSIVDQSHQQLTNRITTNCGRPTKRDQLASTNQVHDEEADRRKEKATEANAGGMDSLVVMPPAIEVQQKWLVSTVAKAEYMPVMDSNFGGGAGGGDFFFQVSPCARTVYL